MFNVIAEGLLFAFQHWKQHTLPEDSDWLPNVASSQLLVRGLAVLPDHVAIHAVCGELGCPSYDGVSQRDSLLNRALERGQYTNGLRFNRPYCLLDFSIRLGVTCVGMLLHDLNTPSYSLRLAYLRYNRRLLITLHDKPLVPQLVYVLVYALTIP